MAPSITSDEVSDEQGLMLVVLMICSAFLSVIGSSTIIYKILRDWAQTRSTTPYERLILCLSICDTVASITLAITPFLLPSKSLFVWAFGNSTTCQASGFLIQLSLLWSWWYNGILSYYFLLTVLSQVKLKNIVRKYEALLHLSGIFVPINAIMGLRRGWYGEPELGFSCYITDPAKSWVVAGIPVLFVYLSLIINYSVIYIILRKTLQSSQHVAGSTPRQERIKREATTLMFLYVASFLVTNVPNFAWNVLEDNFGLAYPFLVWTAIFLPLQGFFNVFIYLKPNYTRYRAANPNKSIYFVLHQALFNPDVPQVNFSCDHWSTNVVIEGDVGNPNKLLFDPDFRPHSLSSSQSSDQSSDSIEEGANNTQEKK